MNVTEWFDRLGISPSELKETVCSLDGTRPYIQAEAANYTVSLAKTYKPDIETIGITNRCEDGLFILFADYDKIYKKIVYKNLDNLLKDCP